MSQQPSDPRHRDCGLQTRSIHAGEAPDPSTGASSPNIAMSSSYLVDEPVSFSATNLDEHTPFIYTRWGNPTTRQLEQKLAALENADDCVAFASGMGASAAVLLGLLSQGDHLIISDSNYPGTAELARDTLPRFGVQATPLDTADADAVRAALRPNTKMIWVETPSNPLLRIADLRALAAIAEQADALLAVDSTFATPIAQRPLELGADLVVHSLTKYIGGHGDALGGAVAGGAALISRLRGEGLIHYGGVISPFNAWLILRGMATLPLRMRAHAENAARLADWLADQPQVERLLYPGRADHPQHAVARAQMDNYSGMISFRVAGGRAGAQALAARMMERLEVIHYAVSLGHQRSLIYLMETDDLIGSSYRLQGAALEDYRELAGDGLFRFSVGLEDADDLIRDLQRVLG